MKTLIKEILTVFLLSLLLFPFPYIALGIELHREYKQKQRHDSLENISNDDIIIIN